MENLQKIAMLIDADNTQLAKLEAVIQEVNTLGRIVVKRAYGNWKKDALKRWEGEIKRLAIKPEQQFDYVSGKNATDMALVIDTIELLHRDLYVVVDGMEQFLVPLDVRRLQKHLHLEVLKGVLELGRHVFGRLKGRDEVEVHALLGFPRRRVGECDCDRPQPHGIAPRRRLGIFTRRASERIEQLYDVFQFLGIFPQLVELAGELRGEHLVVYERNVFFDEIHHRRVQNFAMDGADLLADAVEKPGRLAKKRTIHEHGPAAHLELAGRRGRGELRLDGVQLPRAGVDVGLREILHPVVRVCGQAVRQRLEVALERAQHLGAAELVERGRAREGADLPAARKSRRVPLRILAARIDDLRHLQDKRVDFAHAPVALKHHLLQGRLGLVVPDIAKRLRERGRQRPLRLLRRFKRLGGHAAVFPADRAVRLLLHRRREVFSGKLVELGQTVPGLFRKGLELCSRFSRQLRALRGFRHGIHIDFPRRPFHRLQQQHVKLPRNVGRARRFAKHRRLGAPGGLRIDIRLCAARLHAVDIPDIADVPGVHRIGQTYDARHVAADSNSARSWHVLPLSFHCHCFPVSKIFRMRVTARRSSTAPPNPPKRIQGGIQAPTIRRPRRSRFRRGP